MLSSLASKDEPTGRRFRAILESVASEGASSWLFALPNGSLGQRMTPVEFQSAINYGLLMPQFGPESVCGECSCGAFMYVYGYHALVFRGHLLPRHNLVRNALCDLMVKARFFPVKDAPVKCLGHRSGHVAALRPVVLVIAGDDFDHYCVDVTVVSPLVTNNQPPVVVGKMAKDGERREYSKYLQPCERAGYDFQAFAVDVFGVTAEKSRIWTRQVRFGGYPTYKAVASCLRRISFSVQFGVARQCIACRQEVPD